MSDSAFFHAQLWCYGQWSPGDPRGFRSHDHRVHSSGEYKHRPPEGEHADLHDHAKRQLKQPPVELAVPQRQVIGELVVRWCQIKSHTLIAVACGRVHTHLFVELPRGEAEATIGKMKRYCSTEGSRRDAVIPSPVFARRCEPLIVQSRGHAEQLWPYIVDKHAAEGAWTWGDRAAYERVLGSFGW